MKNEKTIVIGLGNMLMGDEGAGIHAVRHLKKCDLPENIALLDGRSGGVDFTSFLDEYTTIVLVYSVMDGDEAGTVKYCSPDMFTDPANTYPELRQFFNALDSNGSYTNIHCLTISVEPQHLERPSLEPSPAVARSLATIERQLYMALEKVHQEA